MASLPFHLVLSVIVMIMLQHSIKSHCRATEFLSLFSVRNSNVVVLENGTILGVTAPPSLFSLIRIPFVIGTAHDGDHNFRLEAVMTEYQLCMNKNGKLYSKDKSKRSKERVGGRRSCSEVGNEIKVNRHHRRRNRKGQVLEKKMKRKGRKGRNCQKEGKTLGMEPDECLFRIYNFNPNESYYRAAIYSVAYSTAEVGRFIAFGKGGKPRSLSRHFNNLTRTARLGMIIEVHEPSSIERLINNTSFGRSKSVNHMVRFCIHQHKRNSTVFSVKPNRHNKVTKVIRQCRLKYDYTFRRKRDMRRTLTENSLQRNNNYPPV